jgi:hypothetical protein
VAAHEIIAVGSAAAEAALAGLLVQATFRQRPDKLIARPAALG